MTSEPDDQEFDPQQFSFLDSSPKPQRLVKTIVGLGTIRHELLPDRKNVAAGIIIAVLVLTGGVLLTVHLVRDIWDAGGRFPLYAQVGLSWFTEVLECFICVAFLILGGGLLWWCLTTWSLSVKICEQGFEWRTSRTVIHHLWQDMTLVREIILEERLPILKAPLKHLAPKLTSRSYLIQFKDGSQVHVGPNELQGHGTLGFVAQQEALSRGITSESVVIEKFS